MRIFVTGTSGWIGSPTVEQLLQAEHDVVGLARSDDAAEKVAATGASQIWVTHGAEEALVHWCTMRGLEARPLGLVGYGDEEEETAAAVPEGAA